MPFIPSLYHLYTITLHHLIPFSGEISEYIALLSSELPISPDQIPKFPFFLYKETLNSTGSWESPKTRFTHHLEVFP